MVDYNKFDLIVSDGKMPGMSGIELLQKLREREDTKIIPTIMLTGYVDDEMIGRIKFDNDGKIVFDGDSEKVTEVMDKYGKHLSGGFSLFQFLRELKEIK